MVFETHCMSCPCTELLLAYLLFINSKMYYLVAKIIANYKF